MPAPKPDTSPKAVARVLRHLAAHLNHRESGYGTRYADAYALADALEQQAAPVSDTPFRGALTKDEWAAKVELLTYYYVGRFFTEATRDNARIAADATLRAAFPDLVPREGPIPTQRQMADNTNAHVTDGAFARITPSGTISESYIGWNDRVEIVWEKCARANCRRRSAASYITRHAVSAALRAAFPELAPPND